jgi:hypothetical protein
MRLPQCQFSLVLACMCVSTRAWAGYRVSGISSNSTFPSLVNGLTNLLCVIAICWPLHVGGRFELGSSPHLPAAWAVVNAAPLHVRHVVGTSCCAVDRLLQATSFVHKSLERECPQLRVRTVVAHVSVCFPDSFCGLRLCEGPPPPRTQAHMHRQIPPAQLNVLLPRSSLSVSPSMAKHVQVFMRVSCSGGGGARLAQVLGCRVESAVWLPSQRSVGAFSAAVRANVPEKVPRGTVCE